MKPRFVSDFIDNLQKQARYAFVRLDAERALRLKPAALTKGLQRLCRSGRIKMIRRGFYVIVPLEYSASGIVPPDWFIDDLMRFLKRPYYVGVLTAAALHGAAHQQPQTYQVVVAQPERPIRLSNLSIRFLVRKSMAEAPICQIKGCTGFLPVSTPAATALDLVRFAPGIGGLDAVLTVLDELVENMTSADLMCAAKVERERCQVQRLGWLLERTERRNLADRLASWLVRQHPSRTPLDVSEPVAGGKRDQRWQVIVNADPKSEA